MVEATYTLDEEIHKFTSDTPSLVTRETDKNAPTEAYGLRADVMNVQEQINRFLTARMKQDKETQESQKKAAEFEHELLDGDDGAEEEE